MIDESKLTDDDYCYVVSLLDGDYYKQYVMFICTCDNNVIRDHDCNMVFSSYNEARAKAKALNHQLHQRQVADSEAFLKIIFDTPRKGTEEL